jgi:hypothetical protein
MSPTEATSAKYETKPSPAFVDAIHIANIVENNAKAVNEVDPPTTHACKGVRVRVVSSNRAPTNAPAAA